MSKIRTIPEKPRGGVFDSVKKCEPLGVEGTVTPFLDKGGQDKGYGPESHPTDNPPRGGHEESIAPKPIPHEDSTDGSVSGGEGI